MFFLSPKYPQGSLYIENNGDNGGDNDEDLDNENTSLAPEYPLGVVRPKLESTLSIGAPLLTGIASLLMIMIMFMIMMMMMMLMMMRRNSFPSLVA